jgi:Gly-Xaa carboxypeptidase
MSYGTQGIGILAGIVTELEANPHVPKLARDRTYYQGLQCRAKYDAGFPSDMRKLVIESQTSDEKLHELETKLDDFDPAYSASAGTTQAIGKYTRISHVGGLKEQLVRYHLRWR